MNIFPFIPSTHILNTSIFELFQYLNVGVVIARMSTIKNSLNTYILISIYMYRESVYAYNGATSYSSAQSTNSIQTHNVMRDSLFHHKWSKNARRGDRKEAPLGGRDASYGCAKNGNRSGLLSPFGRETEVYKYIYIYVSERCCGVAWPSKT